MTMTMTSRICIAAASLAAITLGPPRAGAAYLMYASEYSGGQVDRFDETGAKTVFATGIDHPKGLAVDASGNVYVASGDHTILKFAPSGGSLGTLTTTGLANPFGIAYGPDGAIWAANSNDNTIHRFSTSGADLGVFASANLSGAEAISFDQAGNAYVSNNYGTFGDTIRKFSPTGIDLGIFATTPPHGPNGSAFDAAGHFFVAIENGTQVHEYSSTGGDMGIFATFLNDKPIALAVAPNGNLFVAQFQSGQIHQFSPEGGDLGVFASGLIQPVYIAFAPGAAVPEPSGVALITVGLGVTWLSRYVTRVRL